jgi:hypothetical protein
MLVVIGRLAFPAPREPHSYNRSCQNPPCRPWARYTELTELSFDTIFFCQIKLDFKENKVEQSFWLFSFFFLFLPKYHLFILFGSL